MNPTTTIATVTLSIKDHAAPTLEARFADGWDQRKARALILLVFAWIEAKTPPEEKWTARVDGIYAGGKPHKWSAFIDIYPHYASSRRRLLEAERGRILDLLRAAEARFSGAYANENNLFTDADLAVL